MIYLFNVHEECIKKALKPGYSLHKGPTGEPGGVLLTGNS
jgi:hypothetical protein